MSQDIIDTARKMIAASAERDPKPKGIFELPFILKAHNFRRYAFPSFSIYFV